MLFPRLLNLAQQSRPGLLVGAETFRLTRLGPIGRVVLWMEREKNALSARQRFTHSLMSVIIIIIIYLHREQVVWLWFGTCMVLLFRAGRGRKPSLPTDPGRRASPPPHRAQRAACVASYRGSSSWLRVLGGRQACTHRPRATLSLWFVLCE